MANPRTLANMLGGPEGEDAAFWNLLRGDNTGENPYGSADYETKLTADEEPAYAAWKAKNSPNDSGFDYDLRGAFKAGFTRDNPDAHMGDQFKKPNHPTFSDQSQYAANAPSKAGTWDGDTYVPHKTADALWPATKLEAEVAPEPLRRGSIARGPDMMLDPQGPTAEETARQSAHLKASTPAKVLGVAGKIADDVVGAPSRAMKSSGYPEGSEEADFLNAGKRRDAMYWGPDMALNMVGIGGPLAMLNASKNTIGIAGGRGAGPAVRDPKLWHDISSVKLEKPLSELEHGYTNIKPSNERIITPADLQDSWLLPVQGDRAVAGKTLTEVAGKKLDKPVAAYGGHGFMSANEANGVGWASEKPVASAVNKTAQALMDDTGKPVNLMYSAMSPRSIDASHHVADPLAQLAGRAKIPKADAAAFDARMINGDKSMDIPPSPNWPGVLHPDLPEYLRNLKGGMKVKSGFAKLMDKRAQQNAGFPNVAEVRHAMTDPRLLNVPSNSMGLSVAEFTPGVGIKQVAEHPSYSWDVPAKYKGGLGTNMPHEVAVPDILKSFDAYRANMPPGKMIPTDGYLLGRTPKGINKAQLADQKWVDNTSKWLEDQKSSGFLLGSGTKDKTTGKAVGAEQLANALEQPNAPTFYSALDRAVADIPQAKAPAEQWAATLANRPGVKPEEIQWRGLDQYLAGRQGQTVTKQEIAAHLAGNKVELGSVVKGGKEPFDAKRLSQLESEYSSLKQHPVDDPSFGEAKYDELIRLMNIRDQSTTDTLYSAAEQAMSNGQRAQQRGNKIAADRYFKEHEMLNTRAEKLDLEGQGLANPTKYSKYQLPGGENYSEKLLTLPEKQHTGASGLAGEFRQKYGDNFSDHWTSAERSAYEQANTPPSPYKSPHWDEPNPVTHMRTNERTIGNTASHHVEEVQSDMHQTGREEGYRGAPTNKAVEEKASSGFDQAWRGGGKSWETAAEDERKIWRENTRARMIEKGDGVPDAPFKKTWTALGLKQSLHDMAVSGKTRLSWTPGEAQAGRYDLSKQADTVSFDPKSGELRAFKGDAPVLTEKGVSQEKLAAYIGKDAAKKLLETNKTPSGLHMLEGEELKVGGEGMIEYYDKIFVNELKKLAKQHGGVKDLKIEAYAKDTQGNPVSYADIPESWLHEIRTKGFPLFAVGGVAAPVLADALDGQR